MCVAMADRAGCGAVLLREWFAFAVKLVATARCFDTAGWLATASWLASAVTAALLFAQTCEETTEWTARLGIATRCFKTASWLSTANWLTTNRCSNFAATGVTSALVVVEQLLKQAGLWGAASWFATASWFDDGFATTDWLATTNGFASGVAGRSAAAEERLHVAKGTCTGSISGEQHNSQNSRY